MPVQPELFSNCRSAGSAQCRERYRYVGPITSGVLEELEYRCTNDGVEVQLRVNGTF